jgi:hypothetical protein
MINDIKQVSKFVIRIFMDYPTRVAGIKPFIRTLFFETFRYRMASLGINLTGNEKLLSSYKNRHKGQRCFIIGNGPSLNKLDLSKLQNETTIGVNAIYLNYSRMGFYPTYYVIEDFLVAEDRSCEINNFRGSVKFIGNHLSHWLQPDEKSIFVNNVLDYNDYNNFPNFSTNALRKVWSGGTVTYICMQLAYYMGFSNVYLIGLDHSYTIPNDAIVEGTDITSTTDDPNHFAPDYFGKGKRWHDPRVDRMERAYKKAKSFFEADGRKIYNATVGGHLEVFDRVDFNNLF